MTIRPAAAADTGAVLALWARSRSASASTRDTEASVARVIAAEALLVAELDGGEIAGALIATSDGWRGNMYRLAVAPEHRRSGIARALVAAGEASLRARGVRWITALVAREDAVAVAVWQSAGYADDAAIARFVKNL